MALTDHPIEVAFDMENWSNIAFNNILWISLIPINSLELGKLCGQVVASHNLTHKKTEIGNQSMKKNDQN